MYQQEIEFFWPLTEQTTLDLDFTPCQEYLEQKRKAAMQDNLCASILGTSITGAFTTTPVTLSSLAEFRPNPQSVGHWEVSPDLRYYVTREPNWIVKKMTKLLLGWKWGKN